MHLAVFLYIILIGKMCMATFSAGVMGNGMYAPCGSCLSAGFHVVISAYLSYCYMEITKMRENFRAYVLLFVKYMYLCI